MTFEELDDSDDIQMGAGGGSSTRRWRAYRSFDAGEVYAAVFTESPRVHRNMLRADVRCKHQGNGYWLVEVPYAPLAPGQAVEAGTPAEGGGPGGGAGEPDQPDPTGPEGDTLLDPGFSFDLSAQTVHITQSLETRYRRVPADGAGAGVGTGPDVKRVIGLTLDGVEGCDVFAPKAEFTRSVGRKKFSITDYYTIRNLTGKTNNAQWYTFARGEVLYLGATVTWANGWWTFTHKFATNENEVQIDIGNGITLPDKRGWEYAWVAYGPGNVIGKVRSVPQTGYVERVYKEGNFAILRIGK